MLVLRIFLVFSLQCLIEEIQGLLTHMPVPGNLWHSWFKMQYDRNHLCIVPVSLPTLLAATMNGPLISYVLLISLCFLLVFSKWIEIRLLTLLLPECEHTKWSSIPAFMSACQFYWVIQAINETLFDRWSTLAWIRKPSFFFFLHFFSFHH